MRFEFKLPDIGEGVVEGEVVNWLVKSGDPISEDQVMVEVMTDKATVEIPSPHAGTVLETMAKVGDTVQVGATLLVIETEADAPQKATVPDEPQAPVAPEEATVADAKASATAPAVPSAPDASPPPPGTKILAAPATRKLAREQGVDLSQIRGTGPHGRITRGDVLKSAGGPEPTAQTAEPAGPGKSPEERIPFAGLRKRIAQKMRESKDMAAHFTYVDEVDMTALVHLRTSLKPAAAEKGVRITYLPFVAKALQRAFAKFPNLNSSLDESSGELVIKHYYNIGIAVDTPRGLYVPVVKNVERKTVIETAREISELAEKCRNGKANLEELSGSSFTITSVGNLGGMFATPIINYPEVAILGLNKIHDRPVVRDGEIVVRKMMYAALSFDHRVIDGAVGAAFTNEVKRYLENPGLFTLDLI